MNRLLTFATVLMLPVVVTACSSSSTPSAHNSPTSAVVPSQTPSSPPTADDRQLTASIQLAVGDLPSGWKSQKVSTTPAQQLEEDTYFDACLGVPTIESEQTTSSDVDFERADGFARADGLINVTKTEAQAQVDQVALTGPKAVGCAVAGEKKFLAPPKGTKIVSITGSKLDVPSGQIGIRTIVTLKLSNGREVTLTSDDIGIIVKRFEVQVAFSGLVQPPQKALEDSVTAKVFERAMANAT